MPPADDKTAARDANRLTAVEAQVALLLARVAAQDREIAVLNATIDDMGPVNVRLGNMHGRLDELEAAAHRHPDEDEADEDSGDDQDEDSEEEADED